ncbi:hypothetical protein XO12_10300 [Marinitoga sp. 1154]|uniref:ATP-binding protein n=1 Tax=Marinitoga sp. 1154 TaxID=1643335 RepID=UPI001586E35C|nr:ATP-binding protein [Marinitoga sp. 1154]NUV00461.1 hypothetical protein [Marinitoga sp. 1154]
MLDIAVEIGKIVEISGMKILVEVTENSKINKLQNNYGNSIFPISLNKLVFSKLPNNKKIIGRIIKISDKNLFKGNTLEHYDKNKYILEILLMGIYDEYINSFDTGINTFPLIGIKVYSLPEKLEKELFSKKTKNYLEIGNSFNNSSVTVKCDPDILFGKHLGVFGNTGTGKTCTIVSIIQGLKKGRLNVKDNNKNISPKIIIFDSNNEYENAFKGNNFKIRKISKEEIKLPHYYLSYTEYYKFLDASPGVQAPVLKEAIENLRKKTNEGKSFYFEKISNEIDEITKNRSKKDNDKIDEYMKNRWDGWMGTLLYRIERIVEDEVIFKILEYEPEKKNIIEKIMEDNENEIFIIEADFDKDELDIIVFLFSKILYKLKVENKDYKNIVLLFEEAHRYINEDDKNDYKLGSYYIERLAREGRKFGISLIISSQRPSELSKTIISQCNSYIIHRITNKNDLEVVSKIVGVSNKNLLDIVPVLEKQNALVLGEAFIIPEIVKIFDADPLPLSHDPEVIKSWRS